MPNSTGGDTFYLELLNGAKLPDGGMYVEKVGLDVYVKGRPHRVFAWLVDRMTAFRLRDDPTLLNDVDYRVWVVRGGVVVLWVPELEKDKKIRAVCEQAAAARRRQEYLNHTRHRGRG